MVTLKDFIYDLQSFKEDYGDAPVYISDTDFFYETGEIEGQTNPGEKIFIIHTKRKELK